MSGELERREDVMAQIARDAAEADAADEFWSYPLEVRQAALEYARGLQQPSREEQPELDGEPQFILVGVQQHGRSVLFASTDVKATRFARRPGGVDRVQVAPGIFARLQRTSILVGAELRTFEQHIGSDYYQALQTLLCDWERKKNVRQRAEHRAQLPPGVG